MQSRAVPAQLNTGSLLSEVKPNTLSFRIFDGASEWARQSYRLRYQVYCREFGYLKPENYSCGHETDSFDAEAIHLGAVHGGSNVVASVRMLPFSNGSFPLEKFCEIDPKRLQQTLGLNKVDIFSGAACEISRLVVCPLHRRSAGRVNQVQARAGNAAGDQYRRPKLVSNRQPSSQPTVTKTSAALETYRALFETSRIHGIRYWLAAMEPQLIKCLGRYGLRFSIVGPAADYYGEVFPCALEVDSILPLMAAINPQQAARWSGESAVMRRQLLLPS